MLDMDTLNWEDPLAHRMKMERNLNFATLPNDEDDFGFSRKKTARDPMSHRIIEKRRRDRMNNCLADLSRLVPTNYLKKGRGRIEKTEIIEMAIKHLKHLQAHPCKDPGSCEVAKATDQDHRRQFRQGYQECMSETMKFMMEVEGSWMVDGVGIRLVNHLQKHYDKISGGGLCYTQALNLMSSATEDSKSQVMEVDNHSSNGSCFHASESNHSSAGQPAPTPSYFDSSDSNHPSSKVTSQLREMLQNPGVPVKDRCLQQHVPATSPQPHNATISLSSEFHGSVDEDSATLHRLHNATSPPQRHNAMSPQGHGATTAVPSGDEFHRSVDEDSATSHRRHNAMSPQGHGATSPPPLSAVSPNSSEFHRNAVEDSNCYKFKNTIKHRFNADLRHHHTSSPTDSHVSFDRMSLPEEDTKADGAAAIVPPPPPPPALLQCGNSHPHRAFSPYQAPVAELTVKIPDRTGSDGYAHQHHWDSQHETASSCGSNPSPPPARSSGSSSGYSTNGDNHHLPIKGGLKVSPLSPYSPPSPPGGAVPVFALHPKGAFYIPLTLESSLLVPYMVGVDDSNPVLHPISICVNLGAHSVKVEKLTDSGAPGHHQYGAARTPAVSSSFLMDKFHDRLHLYSERYYPCPASPPKNGGCV